MSSETFPITVAWLSAIFCDALFYGMYLVTCVLCARTLLIIGSGKEERWVRASEIHWMMPSVAILLFITCTFDVSLGLLHTLCAFADSSDAEKDLLDIKTWVNVATCLNKGLAMILGDLVLLYRCWIVYGRRWSIIIPSLVLFFGNIATGIRILRLMVEMNTETQVAFIFSQFRHWVLAFYVSTAVHNILTTSILIWRIWHVERKNKYFNPSGSTVHQPRQLRKVIRVIAESGAAYTLCVFIACVVSATHSNALYLVSNIMLQMTGITFNLILIRSSPNRDAQFTVFEHYKRSMGHGLGTRNTTLEGPMIVIQRGIPQYTESADYGTENDPAKGSFQDNAGREGIIITTTVVKS